MALRDKNIDWLRKDIWIPWQAFDWQLTANADFLETAADADSGGLGWPAAGAGPLSIDSFDNADETLPLPAAGGAFAAATGPYGFFASSVGTGTPQVQHIATSLNTGFAMTNDSFLQYWGAIPPDLDRTQEVGFRIAYTSGSSTAADTVDWTILVTPRAEDEQLTAASSGTALSTTVAQDTIGAATARLLKVAPRGILAAANAAMPAIADLFWGLSVELEDTAVDANAEGLYFLGLFVDYLPRATYGAGVGFNRDLLTNRLDHDGSP